MYTKQQAYNEIVGKAVWYLDYTKEALLYTYMQFHDEHPEISIPLQLEDVFAKGKVVSVEHHLAKIEHNEGKVFVGDLIPVDQSANKLALQKRMWEVFLEAGRTLNYHGRDNGYFSSPHTLEVLETNE